MTDSTPIKCVICAEDATPKIVKDKEFKNVMIFLWSKLKVDVKFSENDHFDLCLKCFTELCNFYDQNDMCVIFEKRIEALKRQLLVKAMAGVHKRKAQDLPLLPEQELIVDKYGMVKMEKEDEQDLDQYEYSFESRAVDTSDNPSEKKISKQAVEITMTGREINVKRIASTVIEVYDIDGKPKPKPVVEKEESNKDRKTRTAATPVQKYGSKAAAGGRKSNKRGRRGGKRGDDDEDDESDSSDEDDDDDDDSRGWPKDYVRAQCSTPALDHDDLELLKRRQCSVCLDIFASTQHQKQHQQSHTVKNGDQNSYQCRICRLQFKLAKDLIAHNLIHYEQKLFPCPLCKDIDSENKSEKLFIKHMTKVHWKSK